MKLRAKIDEDILQVKENVAGMIEQWGYVFLPIVIACSDKNPDILRIQFLPEGQEALKGLFNNIGSFISESVKDAHCLILVYQPEPRLKTIKIVVKSIDGLSRVMVVNGGFKHNTDTGWLHKKTDIEFFEHPTIDNLEDLWRSYRFNLITK